MRYQERSFSCGPAALVNALRVLGRRVSERRVRALSSCTEEGTDEHGLITAARALACTAAPHHSADEKAAWSFVRASLLDRKPCLLCIDNWGHWVTAIATVGDHIIVADSSTTQKNLRENGIHPMGRRDLLRRWRCPSESEPFYAIAIGK